MTSTFELPITIYYEDTDCTGMVYHSKYINFMERARTEWLSSLGFSLPKMHESGYRIVVHSLQINYRYPAKLNDKIIVKTHLEELGKASMICAQRICLADSASTLLCEARVKLACVNEHSKPCMMPDNLVGALKVN